MHNTMEWVQWTNGAHERGTRIQEMAEDVRELMKNSFVDKRKMKQKTKQNRSFNGPSISRKVYTLFTFLSDLMSW